MAVWPEPPASRGRQFRPESRDTGGLVLRHRGRAAAPEPPRPATRTWTMAEMPLQHRGPHDAPGERRVRLSDFGPREERKLRCLDPATQAPLRSVYNHEARSLPTQLATEPSPSRTDPPPRWKLAVLADLPPPPQAIAGGVFLVSSALWACGGDRGSAVGDRQAGESAARSRGASSQHSARSNKLGGADNVSAESPCMNSRRGRSFGESSCDDFQRLLSRVANGGCRSGDDQASARLFT